MYACIKNRFCCKLLETQEFGLSASFLKQRQSILLCIHTISIFLLPCLPYKTLVFVGHSVIGTLWVVCRYMISECLVNH